MNGKRIYVYNIWTIFKDGSLKCKQYERLTNLGNIKVGECWDALDYYPHIEFDDNVVDILIERVA